MDQVTQTKVQFRREQWKKIITECQSSGIPVRTWCDQHGFKEQSYYYYLKKIREQELSNLPISIPVAKEETTFFKQLEVNTPVVNTRAAVIIHLPSASLEIQNGATQQTVEAVLLALKNIC
ncbi:MAG: IS66 family insertion sequence element accessory protein TnpB [Lachnospiraceae bacterium]